MAKRQETCKSFKEYKEKYYPSEEKKERVNDRYVRDGMALARTSFQKYHANET